VHDTQSAQPSARPDVNGFYDGYGVGNFSNSEAESVTENQMMFILLLVSETKIKFTWNG